MMTHSPSLTRRTTTLFLSLFPHLSSSIPPRNSLPQTCLLILGRSFSESTSRSLW